MISRIVKYRKRKMMAIGEEPTKITLNQQHQYELQRCLEKCGLRIDSLKTINGCKICGMKVKDMVGA